MVPVNSQLLWHILFCPLRFLSVFRSVCVCALCTLYHSKYALENEVHDDTGEKFQTKRQQQRIYVCIICALASSCVSYSKMCTCGASYTTMQSKQISRVYLVVKLHNKNEGNSQKITATTKLLYRMYYTLSVAAQCIDIDMAFFESWLQSCHAACSTKIAIKNIKRPNQKEAKLKTVCKTNNYMFFKGLPGTKIQFQYILPFSLEFISLFFFLVLC